MKIYNLKKIQFLPITQDEAWAFFSSPGNLSKITPKDMGFTILDLSGGDAMYSGQIIRYKITVLPLITVHWITEITHTKEPSYFVDEQRFGPYTWWHHQHHFRPVPGGVEMTDEVNYAIPLGILGQFAHFAFVGRKVIGIFNHRSEALKKYFATDKHKHI